MISMGYPSFVAIGYRYLVRHSYMFMYILSEAVQCFSLSALGLCLNCLPLF